MNKILQIATAAGIFVLGASSFAQSIWLISLQQRIEALESKTK